jgi:hypothetical protein
MSGTVHVTDQFVGIEMLVCIENLPDQNAPRFGELFAPNLKKLSELRLRAVRNRNRRQLIDYASVGHKRSSDYFPNLHQSTSPTSIAGIMPILTRFLFMFQSSGEWRKAHGLGDPACYAVVFPGRRVRANPSGEYGMVSIAGNSGAS